MGSVGRMTVVVLTACVRPHASASNLIVRDAAERLAEYGKALRFWTGVPCVSRVVLVENSHSADDIVLTAGLDRTASGSVEVVRVPPPSEREVIRGKGYSEGKMLDYAVTHSQVLADEDAFFKVTGRLVVSNAVKIIRASHAQYDMFLRHGLRDNAVDTRFFRCTLSTYRERLFEAAADMDDRTGEWIERVYYRRLKGLKVAPILPYPHIMGRSASTGTPYRGKAKWYIKNILAHTGAYTV